MSRFVADIRAQGAVLGRTLEAYRDPPDQTVRRAMALADTSSPVIFTGMGSSLSAVRPAAARMTALGRLAVAQEAGELLHYGVGALPRSSVVVLASQSGRSAETLRLGQHLRRSIPSRIVAIVNDVASPIGRLADVVLPMYAEEEATVATKTFIATFVVAHALADTCVGVPDRLVDAALACELPLRLTEVGARSELASEAASLFRETEAFVIVGRGPSFAAANYAALMLKETVAIPAEAILGGSLRHGPIEIACPRVGVIVLAPDGPTKALSVRLAFDTASLGSPTWLLTSSTPDVDPMADRLVATLLPEVSEALAALLYIVPIQHLAVQLAATRGREPGVLLHAEKVTTEE